MSNFLEKIDRTILSSFFVVLGVSFALSDWMEFYKIFILLSSLTIGCFVFFNNKKTIEDQVKEKVEETLEATLTPLDEYVKKCENTIDEQYETIKEYETIFDSQVASIPCNCGENVFEGIFNPTGENICECEKCKNTYRVSVNFDTVLISTPMELDNH
jgi:hypothetical protein